MLIPFVEYTEEKIVKKLQTFISNNMEKEFFISDNLSFVATAIINGGVSIQRVVFHPEKRGVKNFYLTPFKRANELYLSYVSDQLKVSPSQLSEKIASLKGLQAEIPERGGTYGN